LSSFVLLLNKREFCCVFRVHDGQSTY